MYVQIQGTTVSSGDGLTAEYRFHVSSTTEENIVNRIEFRQWGSIPKDSSTYVPSGEGQTEFVYWGGEWNCNACVHAGKTEKKKDTWLQDYNILWWWSIEVVVACNWNGVKIVEHWADDFSTFIYLSKCRRVIIVFARYYIHLETTKTKHHHPNQDPGWCSETGWVVCEANTTYLTGIVVPVTVSVNAVSEWNGQQKLSARITLLQDAQLYTKMT